MNAVAEADIAASEVPENWLLHPISHLCAEVTDRIDPASMSGNLAHYVGLEHIGQGSGRLDGVGSVADVVSQKTCFQSGDILYGKLRPNLRKVARPAFDGVCSTDVIVLRAKPAADPDFLFQVLQSEPFVAHAVATAAGTKMPRTHARSVLSFKVAVPPLDEQRRIAEVLRSVDEAIAANEDVRHQRVSIRRGLNALFLRGLNHSDFKPSIIGEIPASWSVSTLKDVCHNVGVGIASSATHAYVENGVPLLRNQNIKKGHLDLRELLFVTDDYDRSYKTKRVRTGDVITMRTGYPGRSAVIPAELDGCQTFTTLISRPNQAVIDPKFLCEWINSDLGMIEVRKRQAGGAQQNLNAGSMEQVPVPLPPLDEQRLIANVFQHFPTDDDDLIDNIQSTRRLLQADLLSGRARVPA